MAISKITHMKDCGNSYHGKHLKASIKYITSEWKTQELRELCPEGMAVYEASIEPIREPQNKEHSR